MTMYENIKNKKEEERLLKYAIKGTKLIKYGRYGSPKQKHVSFTYNLDKIQWRDANSGEVSEELLSEFKEFKKGAETKVLKKNLPKKDATERLRRCLSFIGPSRTLDLECKSEAECDEWYEAFRVAFDKATGASAAAVQTNVRKSKQTIDVDKVINALKKFSFDIDAPYWKLSKVLTKGAKFTDEDVMYLSYAMEGNPLLTTLDLVETQLSDQGVSYIASGINNAKNLTSINLSSCQLTNEGAHYLAAYLKSNKSIRLLKLANNNIGDLGANDIAYTLTVNHCIEEIDMDRNAITDEGACSLADALRGNEHVHTLGLSDNQISNEGARYLAYTMKCGTSKLKTLRISRNPIIYPEVNRNGDFSLEIELFMAVDSQNFADAILLTLKGADPNVQNEDDGKTPLHLSSLRGDQALLEWLVEHPQIDMNALDDHGSTALYCALYNKQYEAAKLLLSKKSTDFRIGCSRQGNKTPLHLACEQGNMVIVKLLVEELKDDPAKTTDEGITPLHLAAQSLQKDIVQLLIKIAGYGAPRLVNIQCALGETALHKVFNGGGGKSNDALEVAKILVASGADPGIEDNNRRTAMHDASSQVQEALMNECRKYRAKNI